MKNIFQFIGLVLILNSCDLYTQSNSSTFEISKTIDGEVKAKISKSEIASTNDAFEVYNNVMIADYYENDSLVISRKMKERVLPFKSFYYAQNDTMSIDGAYGMFGGIGFSIKIIKGTPVIYHMAAGDNSPTYCITNDGELKYRIEVPCTKSRLTLSKLPNTNDQETIYGVVEFESTEYYQAGATVQGKEIEDRMKIRMDMKIYFKSNYLDIHKMK